MNRMITAWAGTAVVAAMLSACGAPQSPTHSEGAMLSGAHPMPGAPKPGGMRNELMPERAANCSEAALATMPPEHRQACLNAPNALR